MAADKQTLRSFFHILLTGPPSGDRSSTVALIKRIPTGCSRHLNLERSSRSLTTTSITRPTSGAGTWSRRTANRRTEAVAAIPANRSSMAASIITGRTASCPPRAHPCRRPRPPCPRRRHLPLLVVPQRRRAACTADKEINAFHLRWINTTMLLLTFYIC